jgi:hypothetical protein
VTSLEEEKRSVMGNIIKRTRTKNKEKEIKIEQGRGE